PTASRCGRTTSGSTCWATTTTDWGGGSAGTPATRRTASPGSGWTPARAGCPWCVAFPAGSRPGGWRCSRRTGITPASWWRPARTAWATSPAPARCCASRTCRGSSPGTSEESVHGLFRSGDLGELVERIEVPVEGAPTRAGQRQPRPGSSGLAPGLGRLRVPGVHEDLELLGQDRVGHPELVPHRAELHGVDGGEQGADPDPVGGVDDLVEHRGWSSGHGYLLSVCATRPARISSRIAASIRRPSTMVATNAVPVNTAASQRGSARSVNAGRSGTATTTATTTA